MMLWTIHPITDFDAHKGNWNRLNESGPATPLLDTDFIEPLLDAFGTGKEKLAICTQDNIICALAILTPAKFGSWVTFQPSQSPLGLWIQDKQLTFDPLLKSLRKALPFPCLQVSLTQQDPALFHRPANSGHIKTLDYIQTARVTIDQSFDDYWANRGKNLRQNLKRQRNRLARENTVTKLIQIVESEKIPEAIRTYGDLESAGWKNESGTAIHSDNQQGKFYREMMQRFCNKHQGVVFQYKYQDQIVAVDLCIFNKQSIIILKTTYDETITTSSPAMLMRQDAFATIFEQGITNRIEFYGKVMDWHTKWSDEIRTMYHLNYRLI